MDVLSEVLQAVRLDGAMFYNAELSAPWKDGRPVPAQRGDIFIFPHDDPHVLRNGSSVAPVDSVGPGVLSQVLGR